GLAAGIRLAHFGKHVCVLEKHGLAGGLNSFYRLHGREFDVGLHAVTNYVPRDARGTPLARLLRQLRLRYDDLELCQQTQSEVKFPGISLRFSNDFRLLETEVCEKFPRQADGFRRLVAELPDFDTATLRTSSALARRVLQTYINDPLLTDMLLCPLLYYGSASEDDMPFTQFAIMFRSVFSEGFARPRAGVRRIIAVRLARFKACNGTLRMNCGVRRLNVAAGRVASIELEGGETLAADTVFSSAGYVETLRLCSDLKPEDAPRLAAEAGRMTFMESISILDVEPRTLGLCNTIAFVNSAERFRYRPAAEPVDLASAVVCCPNNFDYPAPLEEGVVRITNIANYDLWAELPDSEYGARKQAWYERSVAAVLNFVPDFRRHVRCVDIFTPRTIHRYTGHANGAVYGCPHKRPDGRTHLGNLFLCGTDQGLLGIIGAMLSGITIANLHGLRRRA
ncbi:MAG: NAD(P)/FAD-dependent oxidoreductase, partial [Planctomycetota bacterium]|nr:NAD(P)/FAD-dependent oxidoreductase [Planctomycetota bacterium]